MSCIVSNCPNVRKRDNMSFYRPPVRDIDLLKKWAAAINVNIEELKKGDKRICCYHFKGHQFSDSSSRGRLVHGAVPSLHLNCEPQIVLKKESQVSYTVNNHYCRFTR